MIIIIKPYMNGGGDESRARLGKGKGKITLVEMVSRGDDFDYDGDCCISSGVGPCCA